MAVDNDWLAVVRNLAKVRAVRRRMTRTLNREGEEPRVSDFFFKAVFQLVILFGVETWVITPRMGRVLGGFQDQVAQRFTGRLLWRRVDSKWEYTSAVATRV